jgi:hypothetical protein
MRQKIELLDSSGVQKKAWRLTAAVLLLSLAAAAQTGAGEKQPAWGTSDSPTADGPFEVVAGAITAHNIFTGAQFSSGGVALRNRGTGSISISGVLTPVKAAYIYWAVITSGAATAADEKVMVERLSPTPASATVTVTGTLLGTGGTPCWTGNTISVFRGVVPTTVATGNGLYKVTLLAGAGGSTAGGDPWVGTPVLPLMEGASIVIVGTGTSAQRVVLYDTGIAGKTFHGNPGFSYSLTLPVAATGKLTLFDSIGADGQHGISRTAEPGFSDESTEINGVFIAGPFSLFNDSDWNGSSGEPLTQLWDDVGHDITSATPSGTKVLNVAIGNEGESTFDCMTPVANVVQEQ